VVDNLFKGESIYIREDTGSKINVDFNGTTLEDLSVDGGFRVNRSHGVSWENSYHGSFQF
jgi:hypothetical protein